MIQAEGEQNFHIFGYLLAGAASSMLDTFGLTRNHEDYE